MTQFVQQYAVVIGQLKYPTEDINNREYLTATRIYKVHSRREHIPRISKLFLKQHHIENNSDNENKRKTTNMTITSKNVIEYTLEIEDNPGKQNEKNRQKKTVN